MPNTIKLKTGSGSDPSASDLIVGEIAIRTDSGKLFTKKDDNSVAEISGGGIDDGDKGDITVSNSGGTFTIDNDVVSFAKMQNVNTSRILGRITSSSGNLEQLTASNVRTLINVEDGATADQSASEIKTAYESNSDTNAFTDALLSKLNGIAASATNVTNNNQLTNGAGYITSTLTEEQVEDFVGGMVTGNTETGITVTYQDSDGTLDFVVASQTDNNFTTTLKNKLDGIATGATNVTNTNQLTNGAGFITATLTNEQVQDIVGGMVTGNTETGISVTYQDGDGTLDFVVGTLNQDTATALETARTIAGVSFDGSANISLNNNAITNGAGYITGSSLNASNLSSGTIPDARFPSTLPAVSGANLTNISATVAGGAAYENTQTISSDYTVGNNKNAMSAGPIEIASGVTVTIGSGETYTIV